MSPFEGHLKARHNHSRDILGPDEVRAAAGFMAEYISLRKGIISVIRKNQLSGERNRLRIQILNYLYGIEVLRNKIV